nr:plexin-A4-like [Lytechinus pictus]
MAQIHFLRMDWMLPVLTILIFLTQTIYSAPLSSYQVSSFTPPVSNLPFNHITINNITGDVYIGARERLYQLNSDLTLKHVVDTGSCRSPDEDNTNNNRLLVIAPSPEDKLITCGGCDGFCETRSLTNISHDVVRHEPTSEQHVVTTSDAPVVGAVVLGADYQNDGVGTADGGLYLFTGISDASESLPSISKHNLNDLSHGQRVKKPNPQFVIEQNIRHLIPYMENLYYLISRYESNQNMAYLGRLCRNSLDEEFASYTEIPIQCGSHNEIQSSHIGAAGSQLADSFSLESTDDLLYAVFGSDISSALCIYKMSDVEQSFDNASKGCSRTDNTRGTENSYLQDSTCKTVSIEPPDSALCTAFQIEDGLTTRYYQYASGVIPLPASHIIPLDAASPTSIVTTIERQHTIAFIGDTQGNLQKVNIVNSTFGYVYETIPLGSGSVLRELFLDESTEQITLATTTPRTSDQGSQVLKLNLANCGQYQTCDECIGGNGGSGGNDGDPYCGWCTLEKRCTRYEACDLPEQPSRWLSYNALQCVSISVQPDNLPYDRTDQQITITVQQLPDLQDPFQYKCAFGTYEVDAATSGDTLTCTSPPANEVPTIPVGSYFVSVDLSIVSTETKAKFVTTDFSFFDCSHIRSCSKCVTFDFPCDWCVYDNNCTDDSSSECQAGDTIIIGDNNPGGTGNQGQEFCPQLLGTTESFLIPVNIPSGFSLSAKNLPTDRSQDVFVVCYGSLAQM